MIHNGFWFSNSIMEMSLKESVLDKSIHVIASIKCSHDSFMRWRLMGYDIEIYSAASNLEASVLGDGGQDDVHLKPSNQDEIIRSYDDLLLKDLLLRALEKGFDSYVILFSDLCPSLKASSFSLISNVSPAVACVARNQENSCTRNYYYPVSNNHNGIDMMVFSRSALFLLYLDVCADGVLSAFRIDDMGCALCVLSKLSGKHEVSVIVGGAVSRINKVGEKEVHYNDLIGLHGDYIAENMNIPAADSVESYITRYIAHELDKNVEYLEFIEHLQMDCHAYTAIDCLESKSIANIYHAFTNAYIENTSYLAGKDYSFLIPYIGSQLSGLRWAVAESIIDLYCTHLPRFEVVIRFLLLSVMIRKYVGDSKPVEIVKNSVYPVRLSEIESLPDAEKDHKILDMFCRQLIDDSVFNINIFTCILLCAENQESLNCLYDLYYMVLES